MMSVLAPEATLNGLEGFEVTAAGSALNATRTAPEKPFTGFTETVTAELVAPCEMEIEFDDRARVKSTAGGGGGGGGLEDEPPQASHSNASRKTAS